MGPHATSYIRQICRLLGAPNEAEAERLCCLMLERQLRAHELLFSAGDRSDTIYIVVRGRIKLSTASDNGKEVILDLLKTGDILGETALVEAGVRQLTAEALEDSTVLGVQCADFEALLQQWPALGSAVAKILARRLLLQQQQLQRLVSKSVSSRLASFLLDEQRKQGEVSELRLDLTHHEVAQLIGTSRETVTALLSRFQGLGILAHDRRSVRILDREALSACACGQTQISPRQPLHLQPAALERVAVVA